MFTNFDNVLLHIYGYRAFCAYLLNKDGNFCFMTFPLS